MTDLTFPPTRAAALARLQDFLPQAGATYAGRRNHVLPGHAGVSRLSPWVRHRVLTEAEVLEATLARQGATRAEKFISEVFWRTYWKGWLQRRPAVWTGYKQGLQAARNRLATEAGLRRAWESACEGRTGIEGFDDWANELVETGWMHNHARMWFASIWIFTLELPWELGADFFLRHLLDGDPASNTLSWRWVAGLHTRGKTYLARPDNIATYTGNRFRPTGLAREAIALSGPPDPAPRGVPADEVPDPGLPTGLLMTEEDLSPGWAIAGLDLRATATLQVKAGLSPFEVSPDLPRFADALIADAVSRLQAGPVTALGAAEDLAHWAADHGLRQIVTPFAPVGPVAEGLAAAQADLQKRGIRLVQRLRPYDARAWVHATHGFFRFREAIPDFLADLQRD